MRTIELLPAAAAELRRSCLLLLAAAASVSAAEHGEILLAQAQPDARNPGVVQLLNQVETLQAEINKLRGQLEVLSNGLENAQKRQRDMYLDLDTRLRRIEQQSAAESQKSDAAGSDLDARVKKLEQRAGAEGAKGRDDQLGELEARIKKLEQQLTSGADTIPAPVSGAAAGGAAATVATPTAPTPPAKPTPPTAAGATPAPSEQNAVRRAYDVGLASYRTGDYQAAIAAFEGIVKKYPRDPLAPNAQYWIGDSWFNLRDFKHAAAAQQALINNYPDSPKIPDALLNLGSAYAALGDSTNARKTLEDLVARFPQTDAAEKGKQRLAKLK